MRKKNIIRNRLRKSTPTDVRKKSWKQLQALAKECGISLSRYVVETGLKHRPRMRLTKEEVDALNSSRHRKDGFDKNQQRAIQENG